MTGSNYPAEHRPFLPGGELAGSARRRLGLERVAATRSRRVHPAAHRAPVHPQKGGDLLLRIALAHAGDGELPAPLQLRRATLISHTCILPSFCHFAFLKINNAAKLSRCRGEGKLEAGRNAARPTRPLRVCG